MLRPEVAEAVLPSNIEEQIFAQPPFSQAIVASLVEVVEFDLPETSYALTLGEALSQRIADYLVNTPRTLFFHKNVKFMSLHDSKAEENLAASALTFMGRAYLQFAWRQTGSYDLNLVFARSLLGPASLEAVKRYQYDENIRGKVTRVIGADLTAILVRNLADALEDEPYWPWYLRLNAPPADYNWDGRKLKRKRGVWQTPTYYQWKSHVLRAIEGFDSQEVHLQALADAGGRTGSIRQGGYRPGGVKHGGIEHRKPGAPR